MKLFQWTGFAPTEARVDHRIQAACSAVFKTKKEFMEVTNHKAAYVRDFVSVMNVDDHPPGNEGARLAIENPGVVYWHDTLRHIPRDAPWLVHPRPERS